MIAILILAAAMFAHAFLLVVAIKGFMDGQCALLWPMLTGISLVCWIATVLSIAELFKKAKRGQDTQMKGGQV